MVLTTLVLESSTMMLDELGYPIKPGYPVMNDLITNIKKENKKSDLKSIFKSLNEME